jgi:hypothetical protein
LRCADRRIDNAPQRTQRPVKVKLIGGIRSTDEVIGHVAVIFALRLIGQGHQFRQCIEKRYSEMASICYII